MGAISGTLYILFILFLVFLAILWIIMPFAVFKMKERQKESLDILEQINANLADLTFSNNRLADIQKKELKLKLIERKARMANDNPPAEP